MTEFYRTPGSRAVLIIAAAFALLVGIVAPVRAGSAQTIQFEQFDDLGVSDVSDLQAEATSGLPVQFSTDTPTVCLVDGSQVFARQVGTCTVVASQPGNATWDPAPVVRRSATIDKGSVKQRLETRDLATAVGDPTDFGFVIRPSNIWDGQVLPSGTFGIDIAEESGEPVQRVDQPFDTESGVGQWAFNDPPRGLAPGWYIAFGCYNGDANYTGSGVDCGGEGLPFQKYRTATRLTMELAPSPARFGDSVTADITVRDAQGRLVRADDATVIANWRSSDGTPDGVEVGAEDGTAKIDIDNLDFGNGVPVFAQYKDPSSNYGLSFQRVLIDVTQGQQQLTFAALYDLEPGDTEALVIESNADNPIEVRSQTPDICRATDVEVTARSLGECVLTAGQEGDERWRAAEPVTRRFDVVKRTPRVSYPDGQTTIGQPLAALRPQSSDLKGQLRFTAAGLPDGITVDATTGVISGTPTEATQGPTPVSVRVQDAAGRQAGAGLSVNVLPLPFPATVAYPDSRGRVDRPFSPVAPQTSGFTDAVRYRLDRPAGPSPEPASGMPAGLQLNGRTGVISGTPKAVGSTSVGIIATDGTTTVTARARIVIRAGVLKPRVSYPETVRAAVGVPMSPAVPQAVGLGKRPRFEATGLPQGIRLAPKSGALRGTPAKAGVRRVAVIARGNGKIARTQVRVRVWRSPLSPSISYPDLRVGSGVGCRRCAPSSPASRGHSGSRLRDCLGACGWIGSRASSPDGPPARALAWSESPSAQTEPGQRRGCL